MGRRGPNVGSTHGLPTGRPRKDGTSTAVVAVPVPGQIDAVNYVPDVPDGLSEAAGAFWCDIWRSYPAGVLSPDIDGPSVARLCRLLDERDRWAVALDAHGLLLEEPIQNAKGDVVGTRLVSNSAAKELRAVDKQIDALSDRIGTTPAARARLGLVISTARTQQATAERIIANKFKGST
jgi:Phage terminase, small subunit